MDKFLTLIGWKTSYGAWDRDEVRIDIKVIFVTTFILASVAVAIMWVML